MIKQLLHELFHTHGARSTNVFRTWALCDGFAAKDVWTQKRTVYLKTCYWVWKAWTFSLVDVWFNGATPHQLWAQIHPVWQGGRVLRQLALHQDESYANKISRLQRKHVCPCIELNLWSSTRLWVFCSESHCLFLEKKTKYGARNENGYIAAASWFMPAGLKFKIKWINQGIVQRTLFVALAMKEFRI